VNPWIVEIAAALEAAGDPERARGAQAYLKSHLEFFGVDSPRLRTEVRTFLAHHPELDDEALLTLVAALWATENHDLRSFGLGLLERLPRLVTWERRELVEAILRRAGTWAHVDWLAAMILSPLVPTDPRWHETLDRWAEDPDFWLRRAALLALLVPLRRGGGDWERFVRYADGMLGEREFFLRKALGWVLREAAKKQPGRVAAFLAERGSRVSALTRREAEKGLGRSSAHGTQSHSRMPSA
jgi:3-methyladenine DNA glycosylase AlkD